MSAEVPDFELPLGIISGQMRPRTDRPVKNGRWYLIRPAILTKVGWGDLSFADMEEIAAVLGTDDVLVVLPEHPLGGQRSVAGPGGRCER